MQVAKALHLALNILMHSKLRSWLTVIGIVIGVASIVSILSIGAGMQQRVTQQLGGLGADVISVTPGFSRAASARGFGQPGGGVGSSRNSSLTRNDVQMLKGISDVVYVQGSISGSADLYYLGESTSVRVKGVDPLVASYFLTESVSGRFLMPGDLNAVVIGSRVGEPFKNPLIINQMVTIGGRVFKIIGTLGSSMGNDNAVIMPEAMARNVLTSKLQDRFDTIDVKVSNADAVDAVTAEMELKLRQLHHVDDRTKDFTITAAKAVQERSMSIVSTFTLFLGAIAAVSLIVGAVGVANTMFTAVLEKTRDIGVMKAIGAKNSDIMLIFLFNSGLVGLVGGLMGVLLGMLISYVLPFVLVFPGMGPGVRGGSSSMTTVVTPSVVILSLLLAVGIGVIAGIIPARNAARMNPVEALRYE